MVIHHEGKVLVLAFLPGDAQGNVSLNLMDYHARMYDSALMRWLQPDTIIGQGPQGLNRYSYVRNSPVKYTDPTGHIIIEHPGGGNGGILNCSKYPQYCSNGKPKSNNDLADMRNNNRDGTYNCKGLECMNNNQDANNETITTPKINWSKVAEGTGLLLLLGALDYTLIAGIVAFAPEIFTAGEIATMVAFDLSWISLGGTVLVDVHTDAINLIWEGFTGEKNKIPTIWFPKRQ